MDPRDSVRLEELLAERATQGLGAESARELEALLAAHPGSVEDDRFDLAAAAIELVMINQLDEMPEHVRHRLASKGRAWAETMRDRGR